MKSGVLCVLVATVLAVGCAPESSSDVQGVPNLSQMLSKKDEARYLRDVGIPPEKLLNLAASSSGEQSSNFVTANGKEAVFSLIFRPKNAQGIQGYNYVSLPDWALYSEELVKARLALRQEFIKSFSKCERAALNKIGQAQCNTLNSAQSKTMTTVSFGQNKDNITIPKDRFNKERGILNMSGEKIYDNFSQIYDQFVDVEIHQGIIENQLKDNLRIFVESKDLELAGIKLVIGTLPPFLQSLTCEWKVSLRKKLENQNCSFHVERG